MSGSLYYEASRRFFAPQKGVEKGNPLFMHLMDALFDRIFTHSTAHLAFSPLRAITLCRISDTVHAGEISLIMSPSLRKGEL